MKILQYNIQSINKKENKDLLELFLQNEDIDIALLAETWVKNNAEVSLCNYNFLSKGRSDGYGGVGIAIRRNITYSIIGFDPKYEIMGITTHNLRKNINIITAYIPPSTQRDAFKTMSKAIFETASRLNGVTLITGDFNAKAVSWGNSITDAKGHIITTHINEYNIFCLNDGNPTFTLNDTHSAIDLSFINSTNFAISWKVLPDKITSSNHLPILMETSANANVPRKRKKVQHAKIMSQMGEMSVGDTLQDFNSKVNTIIQENTIKLGPNNNYVPKPWWDEEIRELYQARTAARRRYTRSKSWTDALALGEAERKLYNKIAKKKRKLFKIFQCQLNTANSTKDMWDMVKNTKKYGQEKPVNNVWNEKQQIDYLNLVAEQANSSTGSMEIAFGNIISDRPLLNKESFERFLTSRSSRSAAGPDNITYGMIASLKEEERQKFYNILLEIWKKGDFPEEWRKIRITPIPKRGKDLGNICNYRPIALMCTAQKILESGIKELILEFTEQRKIIPAKSYAFRPGRSTSCCINDLINTVEILRKSCCWRLC